jgi:diphthine synthase
MLAFVGLGLEQSPSILAVDVLKKCDRILYESYTSPVQKSDLVSNLAQLLGGMEIDTVSREFVEDGRKILEYAKNEDVALLSSGDPMVATTHQDLRVRAIRLGIDTKILHGSSILSALSGELGLSSYSFGRTVTLTRTPMQYTACNTIFQNLLRGLHTILLLEWDESSNFFLSPKDAIAGLLEAEKDLKYGALTNETILLAVSSVGSESIAPKITACTISEAADQDYGMPPITLVIPGKLHFTEIEALSAITGKPETLFRDNSKNIERIATQMLGKYSKKTLAALASARLDAKKRGKQFDLVFENVELYTQDALRFLNEGKEELAILSIGYAEGLLDSLRFSGELNFEW